MARRQASHICSATALRTTGRQLFRGASLPRNCLAEDHDIHRLAIIYDTAVYLPALVFEVLA